MSLYTSADSIKYNNNYYYYYASRDGSGGLFLKRVPKPGGREGELIDEWVEYQRPESERNADFDPQSNEDVSLRNEQVKLTVFNHHDSFKNKHHDVIRSMNELFLEILQFILYLKIYITLNT